MSDKKFYWLKLKKDFFKRHDIHIINGMEQGREIVLFYIKLMIESIDHEGELRFSESVPYTNSLLSNLTDTPRNIVDLSMEVLQDLKLIEINDAGTIILPKVLDMIGSAVDNDNANRQRRYREAQKTLSLQNVTTDVTKNNASVTTDVTNDNESIEIRDKSIEIKRNSKEKFTPPTLEEVISYCQERNSSVDPRHFFDYYSNGNWKDSKGNPVRNWKQKLITWEKHDDKPTTQAASKPRYGMTEEELESVMAKFRGK